MTAVGETVRDLIIVRDSDNAAVTGLVAGDFAALEAYRIASPATTAVVTLTEVGGGEYAISFVPSVAGTWAFHALYTAVDAFAETVRTYEVGAVAASTSVALGQSYLSVDEFKLRSRSSSAANDDAIEAVLLSASRSIDGYCGRTFGQSAEPESRLVDCWSWYGGRPCFEIGDVVSIDEIASDNGSGSYASVWDVGTYRLAPLNAAAKGRPYTEIVPYSSLGDRWWPGWTFTPNYPVRLTGIFGWPAVPAPVKEVCFLTANRLKSLFDAPFGVSGGGEMGSLNMTGALTPIMKEMLNPYVVRTV